MSISRNYPDPYGIRELEIEELQRYISELIREIEAKDATLFDEVNGGTP